MILDALMFWLSRLLRRPMHLGDVMWEDSTIVSNPAKTEGPETYWEAVSDSSPASRQDA